ncbi:MAG: glycosyltransferase family 2 protein [Desulfuromonadales bacterium]|nr:glycosyltransferase family 2 protein [Desulfuromonadales bacterium]
MTKISVVIITLNEESCIERCLKSVAWADEIIVVDSGSNDKTVEIAKKYTDKVFDVPWRGFGLQKQAAVERASYDRIFSIDSDEVMTDELKLEICDLLKRDDNKIAYSVPRRTFLGNKEIKYCGWYPDRTVRFFDRTKVSFSDDMVHERVVVASIDTGKLKEHLLHYSFRNINYMLTKLNLYTDISAQEMFKKGKKISFLHVTLRPLWMFLRTYILRLGFLDGYEGLVISVSNSASVFYKYSKLRELIINKKDHQ